MVFLGGKLSITGELQKENSGYSCAFFVPGPLREKEKFMPLPLEHPVSAELRTCD
jgi:hypothetical protein